MLVLIVTAFMSLGLLNLDFGRGWWRGQRLRLAVGVPLVLLYAYVEMPALVFPQALTLLLFTLVPNAVYSVMLAARNAFVARRLVSMRRTPALRYIVAVAALALFAVALAVAPVVDASGLRDVPEVSLSTSQPPSADLRHVRVVPEESAIFAGEKVIGQLGTYYRVGTYNIQVERGHLVWVAPLEFHGFVQWFVRHTSPGVIVVSAENPDANAELRQRAPMKYVPSAFFNDNLYRHVYLRYGFEQILETTLQLDDAGVPRYLCTLGRPTIGWIGQKVTAVVIVDPTTGAMQRVPRNAFDTLPSWVRRVYPPDLALSYNEWFGLYVHGWWNAQVAKRDVHVPARDEVFGLLAGPQFVWFVDHTSPTSTNQSMTGFTYMDTVSGKITYYTATGGEFDSIGAQQAVASNPLVRQGRLTPTQPILYTVFGENTWVVPLVADTGKYQTLTLVQARNGRVVVGNASAASPQDDAFAQYQALLGGVASVGSSAGVEQLAGTLDRVASTNGALYFTLHGRSEIFQVTDLGDPHVLLAREGDAVTFSAVRDAAGRLIARNFRDSAFAGTGNRQLPRTKRKAAGRK
ncbi:MAG: hypothetical protein JO043_09635 [Candidatus Eremiobacteraeota bacterium]|nr:hypothetical protein [Candidatus Eremiobacteraeota bacterium]